MEYLLIPIAQDISGIMVRRVIGGIMAGRLWIMIIGNRSPYAGMVSSPEAVPPRPVMAVQDAVLGAAVPEPADLQAADLRAAVPEPADLRAAVLQAAVPGAAVLLAVVPAVAVEPADLPEAVAAARRQAIPREPAGQPAAEAAAGAAVQEEKNEITGKISFVRESACFFDQTLFVWKASDIETSINYLCGN